MPLKQRSYSYHLRSLRSNGLSLELRVRRLRWGLRITLGHLWITITRCRLSVHLGLHWLPKLRWWLDTHGSHLYLWLVGILYRGRWALPVFEATALAAIADADGDDDNTDQDAILQGLTTFVLLRTSEKKESSA